MGTSRRAWSPRRRCGCPTARPSGIVFLAALALSSCTKEIGPTVPVTAAAGKSQAAFDADRRGCMATTDHALQPVADRMNAAAQTTDQLQANNEDIQRQYDASYGRCMAQQGNSVAMVAAPADSQASTQAAGHDQSAAHDRSNSQPLSDPESQAAKRFIAPTVRELLAGCTGETIQVDAYDAPLSPLRTARLVTLTQPHGGSCLGEPGENDYLVVRSGRAWSKVLAAEPGSIGILDSARLGYADVELRSLGLCVFTYQWTGAAYAKTSSHDCPFTAPPSVGDVAGKIRGQAAGALGR